MEDIRTNLRAEIYIEILEKGARVVIGDKDIYLRIENLPENVYIGVTGCENINRIYNLKIDDNN